MPGSQASMIGILLVITASIASALLLRWLRCPGWSLIGGVVAGMLLGPGMFGRVAPHQFERLYLGGLEQSRRLRELERDLAVARSPLAGLSANERKAMAEEYQPRIVQAKAARDAARREHGLPLRVMATLAAAIVLFAGVVTPMPMHHRDGREGAGVTIGAMSIGGWQAALPASMAYFFCRWGNVGIVESMLAAASVAIGPWLPAAFDLISAEQAEQGGARTIGIAGRAATVISIGVVIAAVCLSGEAQRSWPLLVLLMVPLGWLWHARAPVGERSNPATTAREANATAALRWSKAGASCCLTSLSIMSAVAMINVEIFADFNGWLVLLMLVLSGDGRWLGAMIGAMLTGGRPLLRAMRLVMGSIAAGPTQIALTMLAMQSGLIGGEVAMALIAGAVLIEIAAPLRRSMARRIAELDEQLRL